MTHYDDQQEMEFSGDCWIGSHWGRKRKWAIIDNMLGLPLDMANREGQRVRAEMTDFAAVGCWWYCRWRVSFPPAFPDEDKAFFFRKSKINLSTSV